MLEHFRCKKCGMRYDAEIADPPFETPEEQIPHCPSCAVTDQALVRPTVQMGHRRIALRSR